LRRRRDELERESPGQRTELVEQHHRVAPLGLEPVLPEDWAQERFELGDRARGNDEPVTERARHVRRVVDQVVGARGVPAVVKELDAEVAIEREHPVAHLVDLMEECAVVGSEREAHDRA
jgi:hypothetical protein